jgi:hypothetical protein
MRIPLFRAFDWLACAHCCRLNTAQRLLLVSVVSHMNDGDTANPGVRRLARMVGQSTRHVVTSLKGLGEVLDRVSGGPAVAGGQRERTTYRLRDGVLAEGHQACPPVKPMSPVNSASPVKPEHTTGEIRDIRPVKPGLQNRPKNRPRNKPSSSDAASIVQLYNVAFAKRLSPTPGNVGAVADAIAAGYEPGQVAAAVVAAALGPEKFYRDPEMGQPSLDVILRWKGGTNPKTGAPARKHLDCLVGLAGQLDLRAKASKLAELEAAFPGLTEVLRSLGATVPPLVVQPPTSRETP